LNPVITSTKKQRPENITKAFINLNLGGEEALVQESPPKLPHTPQSSSKDVRQRISLGGGTNEQEIKE
jgi:hypothetical protein